MNYTVLEFGALSVRSTKARERRRQALGRDLNIDEASCRFRDIPSNGQDHKLKLLGVNDIELFHEYDNNALIYRTAKPCQAVFFDQTFYTFSLKLPAGTKDAWIFSPLAGLSEAADFDRESRKINLQLNFGNDLGAFELIWEWLDENDNRHSAAFASQVYSAKLDIKRHFRIMLEEVEKKFNWLDLDLLRLTQWDWTADTRKQGNDRTWLTIFQQVRQDMENGFKRLIRQHRRKLHEEEYRITADKLKKIPSRLEEKVAEGMRINPAKRYPVNKKTLDADIPENRLMKHLLIQTLLRLRQISDKAAEIDEISNVFKERMLEWADDWEQLRAHHFWRGIGPFRGLRRGSLMISRDPVYASIRHNWVLLQHGLELFDDDLRGGMQNAAQLYEMWCLVKMDRIIRSPEMAWQIRDEKISMNGSRSDSLVNDDRSMSTMKFEYLHSANPNILLQLLFQPYAGKEPKGSGAWPGMMAVPVDQQPDIVLRLHRRDLPWEPSYTWIFDAKYRLDGDDAPGDAVNQMHRYRDAVLWAADSQPRPPLRRESPGAYVLYPGPEDSDPALMPQIRSISISNIGALPLRPDSEEPEKVGSHLKDHLSSILNTDAEYHSSNATVENYFRPVPSVRFPPKRIFAKCVVRQRHDNMNTPEYWQKCRLYRLPLKYLDIEENTLKALQYLVPVDETGREFGTFPIRSMKKLPRYKIITIYRKQDIAINDYTEKALDEYWLFTLAEPLSGSPPLDAIPPGDIISIQSI